MADRGEQPYDPYIPQGGSAAGSAARDGNTRTAALQQVGIISSPRVWTVLEMLHWVGGCLGIEE